jgi:hypothetical protein
MENTAEPLALANPCAGLPLIEPPKLRFVVGTFDSWPQLERALRDLRDRGLVLDSFNCLAMQQLFAEKTIVGPGQEPVAIVALPFAASFVPKACSSGPLADCLLERVGAGARNLKEALGFWLIPRHAAHFQRAVDAGNILFWIKVTDVANERRAYQTLLAHSSGSVGVHDLTLPCEHE